MTKTLWYFAEGEWHKVPSSAILDAIPIGVEVTDGTIDVNPASKLSIGPGLVLTNPVTGEAHLEGSSSESTNPSQMIVGTNIPGTLAPSAGTLVWEAPYDFTIDMISGTVSAAPTGSSLTFRVKLNGSSIGTGTIAATTTYTTYVPTTTAINATDRFVFDILTVGSTTPGNDLVIMLNGTWS